MSPSRRATSDERRASPWPKRPAKARTERIGRPAQSRDGGPQGAAAASRSIAAAGERPPTKPRRAGRGKGKSPFGAPLSASEPQFRTSTALPEGDELDLDLASIPIKISGDTLALDRKICRQIEQEAKKLALRFPEECIDALARINEEFDPLHGHRVRCELRANLGQGRQLVVRDARKDAAEAITEVFGAAKRSLRRLRRRLTPEPVPGMAVG